MKYQILLTVLILTILGEISGSDVVDISSQPTCTSAGKYPTNICNVYWECTQFLWLLYSSLVTCPEGENFDNSTSSCIPKAESDCGTTSTTTTTTVPSTTTTTPTTTATPIHVPECTGPTKHPALLCYQYFECQRYFFSYRSILKACPQGKAFNASSGECVCAGLLNCALPVTELACDSVGTHPSTSSCKEYYECKRVLWWWQPTLKECPSGENYDTASCQCVKESLATCATEPKCYGFTRLPAPEKNQYYECVLDSTGLEWVPQLKTCYVGYVFDLSALNCVPQ